MPSAAIVGAAQISFDLVKGRGLHYLANVMASFFLLASMKLSSQSCPDCVHTCDDRSDTFRSCYIHESIATENSTSIRKEAMI